MAAAAAVDAGASTEHAVADPHESDSSGPGFSESDELRCAVAEAQETAEWRAAAESVAAASAGGVFGDGAAV